MIEIAMFLVSIGINASTVSAVNVKLFHEVAESVDFPPDSPGLSDVCMRLFWIRGDVSRERIIAAGNDYHITWGVWSYISNRDFIEQVRSLGWQFQGTLNGNTYNPDYALLDRDGQPLVAGPDAKFWADPSSPGFRDEYIKTARQWIDKGASSLQRDDPQFGEWHWRGKRDLISEDLLLAFHKWARTEIEKYAGRRMTISVNANVNRPFMSCFNYRMTEVRFKHLSPSYLRQIGQDARKQKMLFVVTGQEEGPVEDFRRAWAGCYATGNLFVVPWDQFNRAVLEDPDAQRTFIAPEKMADLTGFVRANAVYFDGYEDAAVGGYDLKEARYGSKEPVTIEGGSGRLSAFVRARSGEPAAPVVVHLVEWGRSDPSIIRMHAPLFFGNSPVKVRLRVPAPYDAETHALARSRKDYRLLVQEETLNPYLEKQEMTVQLPPLQPWGLLVVEKASPAE